MSIINWVCKKVCLMSNGCRKCWLLIFAFFIFSNFKWILSKILWKNRPFFQWISRFLVKFYNFTNKFNLNAFDNETTTLLNFFEISTEMHFDSLFFLNIRNLATSLLMIYLKCIVVHYVNLNSSSKKKPNLLAV